MFLFVDSNVASHKEVVEAMRAAYPSYRGKLMNIVLDVAETKNRLVAQSFGAPASMPAMLQVRGPSCRGAWVRCTIGQFRHWALQTF
jgi:hypothetical protein